VGGTETATLNVTQMPVHTHVVSLAGGAATAHVKNAAGNQQTPVGNVPAIEAAGVTATYSNAAPDAVMAPGTITLSGNPTVANAGGNQPFGIIQPYLTMNYVIALTGIFPSRN
jgi:microcystin-dependent protein